TAPFEFQINNGPWQTDGVFTDLPPGSYTIMLRDAAGCTHTSNYVVAGPPPVLDSLVSLRPAGCTFGGKIVVAAVSGTAPFEFQINNGAWQPNGGFADLVSGSYTVALRDSAGCVHQSTYVVAPPLPLLDSLLLLTNPDCRGNGSLRVAAISGTPPFQFQLDGEPWQPNGNFAELAPDDYVITLRDSAGCVHTSTYTILPYEPLHLRLDSLGSVDCRHPSGFLAVTATGGNGDYVYQWNNNFSQSSGYFPGLPADFYTITVTDATGCTAELGDLDVLDFIDTALTRETVTIYEGAYFELPDGRRIGRAGQYFLNLETTQGCDSLHIIDVIVLPRHIYVPNIFHPNDDGDNDYVTVFSDASLAMVRRFAIYDRWGELIFEKRDLLPNQESAGWDGQFRGRLVNAGVFIWVAELEFVDGWKRTISGDVTVIR
ncbi:MAG: gliding motility-associated C-terminal domain-containing protein, partial [Saprospiraceae bacterium]|nr:gliding motility-associated C-terminal domain-containing protein [Saprospiraceae bacterium]